MSKVKLETITKDITSYINSKINYAKYEDNKWKEHYNSVIDELKIGN